MTQDEGARTELRAELIRILELLARHLAAQREGGRTPATDPLRGLAIEEGVTFVGKTDVNPNKVAPSTNGNSGSAAVMDGPARATEPAKAGRF